MGQVDGIQLLAHRGHLLYQSHIILALIVRTGRQFIIQDFYFPFHFLQVEKAIEASSNTVRPSSVIRCCGR